MLISHNIDSDGQTHSPKLIMLQLAPISKRD